MLDCVQSGGALPFEEGCPSDHRMLFIDLDRDLLFGDQENIPPESRRAFTSKHPKQTMKYKQSLDSLFHSRGVWTRLQKLDELPPEQSDATVLLNSLDKEITNCMLAAAKRCRRKDLWTPWSPAIWEAGMICRFWGLMESCLVTGRDVTDQLASICEAFKDNDEVFLPVFCTSLHTVINNKMKAQAHLQKCRKNAGSLRDQHLRACAKIWESIRGGDKAEIVRRI